MKSSHKLVIAPRRRRSSATRDVLLPAEDQAEYEALEAQLFHDFAPRDALSEELVRDLAALIWKKRRFQRMEHRLLAQAVSAPLTAEEISLVRVVWPPDIQRRVVQLAFEVPPHKVIALYQTYTFAAHLLRQDEVTLDNLNVMEMQHPELWQLFHPLGAHAAYLSWAQPYAQRGEGSAKVMGDPRNMLLQITDGTEGSKKFAAETRDMLLQITKSVCAEFLDKYGELPLLMSEYEKVYEAVRNVRDQRLLECAITAEVRRAQDELEQAFGRTVQALKKYQSSFSNVTDVSEHAAKNRRAQYKTD